MDLRLLEKQPPVRGYWDVGDQLKRHIYERALEAFARGDARRDAIRARPALAVRQRMIRREFLRGIGGLPPTGGRVPAQTTGFVRGKGFRIEKVIFESRPRTYVTANLYLPDGLDGPRGAVQFLCGHHMLAKHQPEYQAVCQTLAGAGLVVFAQDPVGQGERFSYPDDASRRAGIGWGTTEHDHAGAQCVPLGDGLARWFLHDAMRGFDYLASRPEVDPRRMGVTGNSGGGTQTSLMMLADPRVAAAAPATFLMSRESYMQTGQAQDAEQIWHGFTAAGLDHEDILLAMCPKPVCVLAVKSDFFPIEGTRRTVERCRRLWRLCGKSADLALVEDASVHRYTPRLAAAAAEFFARHLLGARTVHRPKVSPFPPSRLWCTKSGQVMGELPGARAVLHENRDRLHQVLAARPSRERAVAWLRRRIFRMRTRSALNPRFIPLGRLGALEVEAAFWWSQPCLLGHGCLFRPSKPRAHRLPVVLAIWDGGSVCLRPHLAWIRAQGRLGKAVLVLDTAGEGALAPNALNPCGSRGRFGALHKFSDDLMWLGDDLAMLRAWDVTRALDVIAEWPGLDPRRVALHAEGCHGVCGQLAASADPRVRRLTVGGGFCSFASFVGARHYVSDGIRSTLVHGILRWSDLGDFARDRRRRA
ncbi:MAG: prolyl oligopeptidase family serine peptidase [Verrucomicrobiae bacterium]|nr:prolyl oligopeptidase family serine peptidase [Verrucomicrobiae bacterium]